MARPRRSFALAAAILAGGTLIAACGGSKVADVVPANTTQLTPVLTNPTLDNEGGGNSGSTAQTGSTDTTSTSSPATTSSPASTTSGASTTSSTSSTPATTTPAGGGTSPTTGTGTPSQNGAGGGVVAPSGST